MNGPRRFGLGLPTAFPLELWSAEVLPALREIGP